MNNADINVLEALVKTEHWTEFQNWKQELLELFEDHRAMQKRITEMAVERIDAVAVAYHDGAKDMRERCAQSLSSAFDAGAAGVVRSIPLPERTLSLL